MQVTLAGVVVVEVHERVVTSHLRLPYAVGRLWPGSPCDLPPDPSLFPRQVARPRPLSTSVSIE